MYLLPKNSLSQLVDHFQINQHYKVGDNIYFKILHKNVAKKNKASKHILNLVQKSKKHRRCLRSNRSIIKPLFRTNILANQLALLNYYISLDSIISWLKLSLHLIYLIKPWLNLFFFPVNNTTIHIFHAICFFLLN